MLGHMRKRRHGAGRSSAWPGLMLAPLAAAAAISLLSGCGSGLRDNDDARADVDAITHASCASTVLQALGGVATRVYGEGISSERTGSALHIIESSTALRAAVERDDAAQAGAAARALIATGHLTNLRVVRNGRRLIDVGGRAVAPLKGTLKDASGKPIASFQTSVWAAGGLVAEVNGIAEGQAVLRTSGAVPSADHDLAGAIALPPGELPAQGTLTRGGVAYQFSSLPVSGFPSGDAQRLYVLRTIASTAPLCGSSDEDTTVNTLSHIARLIYDGEAGKRTLKQIRRVQANAALLQAVAKRNGTATRKAIEALLHQHIVRLRVSAGGHLLSDVGGPYVLAPVTAPLRRGGHTIGSFTMSIQDDEGYKRLANRLAGLDVLMYMNGKLVKSTLGASPGAIPTTGSVHYAGKSFRAYTFIAEAFPSGPLRITVLIPLPYS
jgi:hypothetical protein